MSIKRSRTRTADACVSSSPSKIPYGGFSPVRLQTGSRRRPSSGPARLIRRPSLEEAPLWPLRACVAGRHDQAIPSRGPWLADRLCCPARSSLTMTSSAPLAATERLICFVRSAPTRRVGPQFNLRVCSHMPSPVPRWTDREQVTVASPTALVFAVFARARHPRLPRTLVPTRFV